MNKENISSFDCKWWRKEIPCLHRVHVSANFSGAHEIQNMIGMSISLEKMETRLQVISQKVAESNKKLNLNQKVLLTFDDGHRDVLLTTNVLENFPLIQPVLFLTGKQLNNDTMALPLTALYSWCYDQKLNPNELVLDYGFSRDSLKALPESEQRNILKNKGIDINPLCEEMISLSQVNLLVTKGWLIGYHGSSHCDLRIYSSTELEEHFKKDFNRLKALKFEPWIAWPEGRWNDSLAEMALKVGFETQFGLENEKGVGSKLYCINRKIWN